MLECSYQYIKISAVAGHFCLILQKELVCPLKSSLGSAGVPGFWQRIVAISQHRNNLDIVVQF
jgi:hypothetical protein